MGIKSELHFAALLISDLHFFIVCRQNPHVSAVSEDRVIVHLHSQ